MTPPEYQRLSHSSDSEYQTFTTDLLTKAIALLIHPEEYVNLLFPSSETTEFSSFYPDYGASPDQILKLQRVLNFYHIEMTVTSRNYEAIIERYFQPVE